jgi:CubicO group peptidase (beta-lactamase class C family)
VTKQFTGAAIAKLADEGKLDLDTPIAAFFPDFPHAREITVRALVNQEAGIPSYNDFADYEAQSHRELSVAQLVDWIAAGAGDFKPNPGYAYSNSHFALLARIIELVTGQSYPDYLRAAILAPAGMADTDNYSNSQIVVGRVRGYDPGPNGTLVNAPSIDNSIRLGSGSLSTTSDDLVRWNRALQGDDVLSEAAKAIYLAPRESGYAMGISVGKDEATGERIAAHDGKVPGAFAYMKRWLDSGRALIVLSNVNSGQMNRFKTDLTRIVDGETVPLPERRRTRKLHPGEAAALVGHYLFPPAIDIRIATRDDSLVLYWRDTGLAQYLVPLEGSDWYYMPSRAERIRFVRNAEGVVESLDYDWGNGIQSCKRLAN